jgi:acetoin utilization deacetylase AcuC-like enzyme
MSGRKNKIAYFYDHDYTGYYYGPDHPMKPQRIAMTHQLVLGYELHKHMDVYRPRLAQYEELTAFHSEEFVDVLRDTTPEMQAGGCGEPCVHTCSPGPCKRQQPWLQTELGLPPVRPRLRCRARNLDGGGDGPGHGTASSQLSRLAS